MFESLIVCVNHWQEEEQRMEADENMHVKETRQKSQSSQQQNNQQESVNQQSSGPSVTCESMHITSYYS